MSVTTHYSGLVSAQSSGNAFNSGGSSLYSIPSNAVVGSTTERRDAWNNLSDTEKAQASQRLQEMVQNANSQSAQQGSQSWN